MSLACSDADRAAGDSPVGSATTFDEFLLLDYRSPWGREAAADAVRDQLSAEVHDHLAGTGSLRPFAIRPVADRRGAPVQPPRWGRVGPAACMTELADDFTVADLRLMTEFMTAPPAAATAKTVIGVCTNARRDRCCAVRGRPVAAALLAEFGPAITEISHLGGHRFAATMLVLPVGYFYGVLDPDSARRVASAALDGLVDPANLRGRADLSPAAQAADAFWRAAIGTAPVDAVRLTSEQQDEDGVIVSAVVQGTADRRRVRYLPGTTIAATACGGKPITTGSWLVEPV